MGGGLVDQRSRVLHVRERARTPGRVENRGLTDEVSGNTGDCGDSLEIIHLEASPPSGKPSTTLGFGPRQPLLDDRPREAIEKDGSGPGIRLEVDRRSPAERVV